MKVIFAWTLVLAACVACYLAPASVPGILPGLILLVSRAFLWPAFPAVSRIVWPIFWCTELLVILAFLLAGVIGKWLLVAFSLPVFVSIGLVVFLFVSDVVIFYRSFRERNELRS
jgi:hypothetical protein